MPIPVLIARGRATVAGLLPRYEERTRAGLVPICTVALAGGFATPARLQFRGSLAYRAERLMPGQAIYYEAEQLVVRRAAQSGGRFGDDYASWVRTGDFVVLRFAESPLPPLPPEAPPPRDAHPGGALAAPWIAIDPHADRLASTPVGSRSQGRPPGQCCHDRLPGLV